MSQNSLYPDYIVERGLKKWTAMMLPEHKVMLKEWEQSQEDVFPPERDEIELAELAEKLSRAMMEEEVVSLKYWKNKRHITVNGIIKRIDPHKRAIWMDIDEWDKRWIPAIHVISID